MCILYRYFKAWNFMIGLTVDERKHNIEQQITNSTVCVLCTSTDISGCTLCLSSFVNDIEKIDTFTLHLASLYQCSHVFPFSSFFCFHMPWCVCVCASLLLCLSLTRPLTIFPNFNSKNNHNRWPTNGFL